MTLVKLATVTGMVAAQNIPIHPVTFFFGDKSVQIFMWG
jgi:hypothetical protein